MTDWAAESRQYAAVVEALFVRRSFDLTLRSEQARLDVLAEIKQYLLEVGSPDRRHTVHVTGTNGKGSTAIMVEAILRRAGARTLLETSPHLEQVTERIAIDGHPIEREHFTRLAKVLLEDPRCTRWSFFDLLTVLGFLAASQLACDWQVLEVGIGGRLDTTNVVPGKEVAVLTSIDLEHTAVLGDTIAQIAREKSAIVNCACDVVVGASVPAEAIVEVQRAAALGQARVHLVAEECTTKLRSSSLVEQVVELCTPVRSYELRLALLGTHQIENAAAAVRAAELALGDALTEPLVVEALRDARNPGRLEFFPGSPCVVLDAMHTAEAALRFCDSVSNMPLPASRALVFAALADKRLTELVTPLAALAESVFVAPVANPRTADPEALAQAFRERHARVLQAQSIGQAIDDAKRLVGRDGVVFVVGGVYTVAEARAHLVPSAD